MSVLGKEYLSKITLVRTKFLGVIYARILSYDNSFVKFIDDNSRIYLVPWTEIHSLEIFPEMPEKVVASFESRSTEEKP